MLYGPPKPDVVELTIMTLPSVIAFAFTDYIINGEKHKAKYGLCKKEIMSARKQPMKRSVCSLQVETKNDEG